MMGQLQVFTGTAHPALAQAIADHLGIPLGAALVTEYKNGETRVCIEENVRGSDVFVVQPTCHPVNHHLMEFLIMMDAIKRASATRITAVMPYYGYAKQEKKSRSREPITAKLVADLLQSGGSAPHISPATSMRPPSRASSTYLWTTCRVAACWPTAAGSLTCPTRWWSRPTRGVLGGRWRCASGWAATPTSR